MRLVDFLLVATAIYCAYTDVKHKKVRNVITLPLIVFGFLYNAFNNGLNGIWFSLKGILVGSIFLLPAIAGVFGMGDVKLFMGIGAVKGAVFSIDVIFFSLLSSVAVAFLANPRRFLKAISNIWLMLKSIFLFGTIIGVQHGKNDFSIPYALCICLGLIVAYLTGGDFLWTLLGK